MDRPERRRRCSGFQNQQGRLRGWGSGGRTPPRTPRRAGSFAPPCRRRRCCSALPPRGPDGPCARRRPVLCTSFGLYRAPICVTMAQLHLFPSDGLPSVRAPRPNCICFSFFCFDLNQGGHAENEVSIRSKYIKNMLFMHTFFSCHVGTPDERIRQEQIIHTHESGRRDITRGKRIKNCPVIM